MAWPAPDPGRLLERGGDAAPRGMTAAARKCRQNPAYRPAPPLLRRTRALAWGASTGPPRRSPARKRRMRPIAMRGPRLPGRRQGGRVRRRPSMPHLGCPVTRARPRRGGERGASHAGGCARCRWPTRAAGVRASRPVGAIPRGRQAIAAAGRGRAGGAAAADFRPQSQNLRQNMGLWISFEQVSEDCRKSLTAKVKVPAGSC